MGLSFSTICERMRAHAVYLGEGLLFPRATEAEIQAAEARLGFNLPQMMRELYMTVANGSDFFGPGYWFPTISNDFARKHTNYPVLDETPGDGPRPFDDATVEALRTHPGAFVVCERLPARFIEIAHVGCNVWVFLDGFTGHLYLRDDHYKDGEFEGGAFSFCASSLEEWLERRLAAPPSRSSEGRYQPHYPLADVLGAEKNGDQSGERQADDSPLLKSSIRRGESPMDVFRRRLLVGLEQSRAEITRQIYDLDAIQSAVAESDAADYYKQDWSSKLSMTMQQLAELEAQLDDMINTPWLFGL